MKTNKLQQLMDGTLEALAKANASDYFQKLFKTVSRQFIVYAGEHDIDSFNIDVGLQFLENHYSMSQKIAEKKWCSMYLRCINAMYLPLDSIKGLLDQPDRTTTQGRRDAVLLSLLYDTGARVQELVDLKVCDINLNDTVTVTLTGKGGKSRIVPVMAPTGELLRQYIEGAGLSHPSKSRTPLFTNRGRQPLTRAGVTYILKKYASQAQASGVKDISGEITPHWLRHSKAMHLLQSGVNLIYIRDLLGHSDVSTTEIYARADETMKRKALLEAYKSPTEDKLPEWKTDKNLLDWLKSL